jgi:hypothetical protein
MLKSRRMGFWWALFLWLPVPFYAYSVSFGSVPIFLPVWWPHSFYNTRYGMEMLPGFALGVAFAASFLISATREFKPKLIKYATGALLVLVVLCDWAVLRDRPLTYVEGTKNIASRRQFEEEIPPVLRRLVAEHPGAPVLMGTSVYPNLVAFTGIPLRQTINESDRGIFSEALADPAKHAAVVVAFDGDEIDKAVKAHSEGLRLVGRFACDDQKPGAVYVSDTPPVVRE